MSSMLSSSTECSNSINLDGVNTEQLSQLAAYQSGLLRFSSINFPKNAGAFLPCRLDLQHYHVTSSQDECEPEPSQKQFLLHEMLKKYGTPIQVQSIVYDKPIAVIYNPVSGSKINVKEKIRSFLHQRSIPADFFETKYHLHAWDLVEKEINLENYSAIAAVGGDGTLHEVVNGWMNRNNTTNNARPPPVAFLPNGTGNDTLKNFQIENLEQALEFIAKGDVIKMDCNRLTFDAENRDEIPNEEQRSRVRYSIANSAAGFVAAVNKKAACMKQYVGRAAYTLTGIKELLWTNETIPKYDITLEQPDGSKMEIPNMRTMFLFVNNGRFAGGGTPFTPAALLNDGLLDVVLKEGSFGTLEALHLLDKASRKQGEHVLGDETIKSFRAKSILLSVKESSNVTADFQSSISNSASVTPSRSCRPKQMYQVDGENFEYSNFVRVETICAALDVIVDFRQLMSKGQMLNCR